MFSGKISNTNKINKNDTVDDLPSGIGGLRVFAHHFSTNKATYDSDSSNSDSAKGP